MELTAIGAAARVASRSLMTASTQRKNEILKAIADGLISDCDGILSANKKDLDKAHENGISDAMCDRLMLNPDRIKAIAGAVLSVVDLPDPVGIVLDETERPNGIKITKISVPMGVIGIIFESRPNVTVDAAVLCLKAGSAVILRGGKEAINSNTALCESMRASVRRCGFDENCINLITDTSRESATALMQLTGYIDLLIPRGGAGLIRSVVENSKVPVIETGTGNCHIYVDANADVNMAVSITDNAKTQRPSVCNAAETLLVHKDIAEAVLPKIKQQLDKSNVEIRGCEKTKKILGECVVYATEDDYYKEFLDYIIAVKVVDSLDEAIGHIVKYSSGHSECIVTEDKEAANKFVNCIDSAAVYVNASTRFTDGGEFGFGAEIGISTQKLHARGPMGLAQITSYKYIINGNGQIR